MEKPLGHYVQVVSPDCQTAYCNQKTPIPVSWKWDVRSEEAKKKISINTGLFRHWHLFTGGLNSILIWVLKTQSFKAKNKDYLNQLLSITHEIYSSFDDGFEVRSVFLDISKAFDKVWHEGIIFKLQQNGILDDLLNILSYNLRNRKQRIAVNGSPLHGPVLMQGFPKDLS